MRGICESFCPTAEEKMRTREKLLHFYEYKNGDKTLPGVLVKAFARSAAGVKTPKPLDLRTESCMIKTIEYLLKNIFLDKRRPYNIAYDFIFDRLRAVRQEIVIQTYDAQQTIRLLEPMIMFLAYSRYHLCSAKIDLFDPKICEQHLQECLKRVLCCYDELGVGERGQDEALLEIKRRCHIEALYQVFNLGAPEALVRGLTLPKNIRTDAVFDLAFDICMNYYRGNLYRVLKGVPKLPHIICALASLKLQAIRRKLIEIFAHAYNNKQLKVEMLYLRRLLIFSSKDHLIQQCKHYNITVNGDSMVIFSKTDYKSDVDTIKAVHESFVEEKLERVYLPDVLLLKKL